MQTLFLLIGHLTREANQIVGQLQCCNRLFIERVFKAVFNQSNLIFVETRYTSGVKSYVFSEPAIRNARVSNSGHLLDFLAHNALLPE